MRGLTGLCLVCFLLLPTPGGAEETLSAGAWWCLLLSREAVDCRRYTPGDAPARGENVVAVGKFVADVSGLVTASGPLRLHTRYTSVIVRHKLTRESGRPRLRFALPGTPEGKEQSFIVESERSAYIMRSGGSTSFFYMRMPGLDAALDAAVRAAVTEERVLILCDALPDEPFSAPKALSRNHTIYALGDAAVVVAARAEKGGTWSGASACLRGGYTPLFVLHEPGEDFAGNRLLLARGARPLDLRRPVGAQLFANGEDQGCR